MTSLVMPNRGEPIQGIFVAERWDGAQAGSRLLANVFVPYNMRKLTGGKTQVKVPGKNLRELIDNLDKEFPGMKESIVEDDRLKPGLAAIVGEQPTRQGLMTKLDDDSEVHFLPAISGGCGT